MYLTTQESYSQETTTCYYYYYDVLTFRGENLWIVISSVFVVFVYFFNVSLERRHLFLHVCSEMRRCVFDVFILNRPSPPVCDSRQYGTIRLTPGSLYACLVSSCRLRESSTCVRGSLGQLSHTPERWSYLYTSYLYYVLYYDWDVVWLMYTIACTLYYPC